MTLLLLCALAVAEEIGSPSESLWYGMAVAGPGDVNGDGYDDALVGAPGSEGARAYLYLGGAGELANPPDQELYSLDEEGDYAVEVSAAGDVDGDGLADLAVGERSCAGMVYVYLGARGGLDLATPHRISGPACDATVGEEIAAAGDMNGDGYDDLAVGSQESEEDLGLTLLFYGSAEGLPAEQDRTLSGVSPAGAFGGALSGAGDMNGDGYADLLVGARKANGAGEVHLFLGGVEGPGGESDARLADGSEGLNFGAAVAGLGDLDGDGLGELAVGAPGGTEDLGSTFVYLGSADGAPTLASTLSGPSEFSAYGAALAGPGDIDADGHADLLVGAYFHQRGRGALHTLWGAPGGLADAEGSLSVGAEGTQDWLGFAMDGGGDLDGDGYADTLVTALGETMGRGVLHVLRGGERPEASPGGDSGGEGGGEGGETPGDSADTATEGEISYELSSKECACATRSSPRTSLSTLLLAAFTVSRARRGTKRSGFGS